MNNLQDLSKHLHSVQADAKVLWGEDTHDACVENGELIECSNCGGTWPKAKYCWQHQLQRLIISKNGPAYLKEHQ